MADMNLQNTGGFQIQTGSQNVKITEKSIASALKNIAAPVFDFFTKTDKPEETQEIVDYEQSIAQAEMRNATIQGILNQSDPNAKRTINIVI